MVRNFASTTKTVLRNALGSGAFETHRKLEPQPHLHSPAACMSASLFSMANYAEMRICFIVSEIWNGRKGETRPSVLRTSLPRFFASSRQSLLLYLLQLKQGNGHIGIHNVFASIPNFIGEQIRSFEPTSPANAHNQTAQMHLVTLPHRLLSLCL